MFVSGRAIPTMMASFTKKDNHALFPHDGLFLSTPKMRPTTISVFGAPKNGSDPQKLPAENFCHGGWGAGKVKPGGPTSVFLKLLHKKKA